MIEFTSLGFLSTLLISSITVQEAGSVLPCKQASLIWHNHFRRIHQVANVTWSKKLCESAAKWATYLATHNKFEHDNDNPGNIFLSPGSPPEPCARAVKLFYEEEKNYNYKKPQYYQNAAHFTQLVWKNTKQIGAASEVRNDGKTVVVIKYLPPGNVAGYYAQNVFPPRKHIVTTPAPDPNVTTAGNTTSGNFTVTKPDLSVRAGISSVNAWRAAYFVQWLFVVFLIF